ncbi:MAG: hypothetical protein CML24_14640 [Rhizobiales bacterium]|nr:hypothetical protein [Hyphomicrobiales bacterium]|tara:strand:- start:3789 stop:4253 length:465 start_codon:yes stop_codon:yes gene_type:complete
MAKQDDYARYTIRVPQDLYARLQRAAGEKSINAEITERLEQSFYWPQSQLEQSIKLRIDQARPNQRASRDIRLLQRLAELYPEKEINLEELIDRLEVSLRGIEDPEIRESVLAEIEKIRPTVRRVQRANDLGIDFEPNEKTLFVPLDDVDPDQD